MNFVSTAVISIVIGCSVYPIYDMSQGKQPHNTYCLYNYCKGNDKASRVQFISTEQSNNLEKLREIAAMPDNWNDNGASAFDHGLICLIEDIILALDHQPEVFPTACDSIQIEYEKDNGEYLELEVFSKEKISVYREHEDGSEETYVTIYDKEKINRLVNEFYGTDK